MPETVVYTHEGQSCDLHVVRPPGKGPHGGVLVFHAWGGRGEFEEGKAAALAELGYVGMAVDLYGVGRRGHDKASSRALMMELVDKPALLRARIAAAFEAASKVEGVDTARMAGIGFCFGGLSVLLAARMGLTLRGVVSFHGLLKVGEPIEPQAPVQARIMVQHGQDDPMVSAEDLASFAAEMKRVGADWQLHAYPGVVHAFTNPAAADPDFGTVYNAAADSQSWREMRQFLAEVLG